MFRRGWIIEIATAAFFITGTANADVVDDWLDGKNKVNWPEITYDGPPITLRFTSAIPSSSTMVPLWNKGIPLLETMTNGKIVVSQFHNGTVHGALDGFKAVRENLSDLAVCYVSFRPQGFDLTRSYFYPFVSPSRPAVANRVFAELAPKYLAPEFEKDGVLYAQTTHFGQEGLVSTKPVARLEDVEGLKVAASGAGVQFVEALGGTAVSVPPFDRYSAIQTGVVDGTLFTDVAILSLRLYEVAKNHTVINSGTTQLDHCVRKEWFEQLPSDLQRAFALWQQGMAAAAVKIAVLEPKKELDELYKQHDIRTIVLDEAETERWKAATKPVLEAWLEQTEAAGKPARKFLDEILKKSKSYELLSEDELFLLAIEEPVSTLVEF